LSRLVADATESLDGYDYARVLERTESFFWGFCDDYLEMVKPGATATSDPRGRRAPTAPCSSRCRRCCGFSRHICRSSPRKCGRGGGRVGAPRHWPTPAEVIAPIGGEDAAAVTVFKRARTALADIRRIKAMEKRAVKSVIEQAVLSRTSRGADAGRT
jgi:valyl-tRNA synthetase